MMARSPEFTAGCVGPKQWLWTRPCGFHPVEALGGKLEGKRFKSEVHAAVMSLVPLLDQQSDART